MPSVMILEDDTIMLGLLRIFLEMEDIKVSQPGGYQNLEQAVNTIQVIQPDLILLDVQLSQFNGFDLLRTLRKNDTTRLTRVLIMSGRDVSHECFQEGADGFIMKPFMPDDLLAKIHQLVGK